MCTPELARMPPNPPNTGFSEFSVCRVSECSVVAASSVVAALPVLRYATAVQAVQDKPPPPPIQPPGSLPAGWIRKSRMLRALGRPSGSARLLLCRTFASVRASTFLDLEIGFWLERRGEGGHKSGRGVGQRFLDNPKTLRSQQKERLKRSDPRRSKWGGTVLADAGLHAAATRRSAGLDCTSF